MGFSIKRVVKQNRAAASRINPTFNNVQSRAMITKGIRNGSTIRSIQNSIRDTGARVSQRDIFQFVRTNYADRTFNKWLNAMGERTSIGELQRADLFEKAEEGIRIKGFVRGTDMKTNTKVFHTVDVIVNKNTNLVSALESIRSNGLARLNDSLQVELEQTGFIV